MNKNVVNAAHSQRDDDPRGLLVVCVRDVRVSRTMPAPIDRAGFAKVYAFIIIIVIIWCALVV